jgi:polygalacturonase
MKRREFLQAGFAAAASAVSLRAHAQIPALFSAVGRGQPQASAVGGGDLWNVRAMGARGDGAAIDSAAINKAIEAAAAAGGGTVFFPAGVYRCYSIRLKSHVGLHLDHGAVILAAENPAQADAAGYDPAEPHTGAGEAYQDFGHNHWHNSLLWGEGGDDISITGPGVISGKALPRSFDFEQGTSGPVKSGGGNTAIALKNCRNVLLRDFTVNAGGWFGILATGVDNLAIDHLTIDSNRDGMDIDCCRNVRIRKCTVNRPWDDGICL